MKKQNSPATFLDILTILFIGLKLAGFIDWNWLLVTAPMTVPIIIFIIVTIVKTIRE